MMTKIMNQYKDKVMKAVMVLFAASFAIAGTTTLTSCSSDDDPFFTVSEDDDPRILNTDLADSKIDRKTNYKLEIKVTPVHYTTVTWLLDGTQIYEGTSIDQALPVGTHELKIVATTTKGKSTSRTLTVTVTPTADDPALGTNAVELWVAPGETTTIHNCHDLDKVQKVMIGGKEAQFSVSPDDNTTMTLTAPEGLANNDYDVVFVTTDGAEFVGGTIKVTTEPKPASETTLWEGSHYVSWDLSDGNPNKTFNLISKDEVAKWKAGQVLRVYVTPKADDEYHQIQLNTGWWTGLNDKMDFSEDTKVELTLTQEIIDLLNVQDGFLVTGHGFYVTKVTIE